MLNSKSRVWCFAATVSVCAAVACGSSDDETGAGEAGSGPSGTGGASGASPGGMGGGTSGVGGGSAGAAGDSGLGGAGGTAGSAGTSGGFLAETRTFLVHAAPSLFAARVCIATSAGFVTDYPLPYDAEHHLPETNFPGVAVGGAVEIDDAIASLGGADSFTAYIVRADQSSVLRASPSSADPVECEDLFESGGFDELPATDYFLVDDIQMSALNTSTVRAIILDSYGQGRTWGFSPTLSSEPVKRYLFAAHASPSLSELQMAGQTIRLGYGELGQPPSTTVSDDLGETPVSEASEGMDPPDDLAGYAAMGFTMTATDSGGTETELLAASLANVQRVSSPYAEPEEYYASADAFLLLVVGDTNAAEPWLLGDGTWNESYDGTSLHILALPFVFTQ